jgi:hypothetical protein
MVLLLHHFYQQQTHVFHPSRRSVIHQHFQVTCFLIYFYFFNKFPLCFTLHSLYNVWQCYAKYVSTTYFSHAYIGWPFKSYWLRDVPTSLTFKNLRLWCFVFIWEQTVTFATYIIGWLDLITELKSVYSAVRNGPLNKAVCASSFKG